MLEKLAGTALNSKLVASHKDMFSKMVVDAVLHLDSTLDLNFIGMKKERYFCFAVYFASEFS
jgi:T-complex protein 1 subunit eta